MEIRFHPTAPPITGAGAIAGAGATIAGAGATGSGAGATTAGAGAGATIAGAGATGATATEPSKEDMVVAPAGTVAVIWVSEGDGERRRGAAKFTAVAPVKPVPVMVTGSRPAPRRA